MLVQQTASSPQFLIAPLPSSSTLRQALVVISESKAPGGDAENENAITEYQHSRLQPDFSTFASDNLLLFQMCGMYAVHLGTS